MAYSALEIAAGFIKKGKTDNKPFTELKLQCMVYYAHGYHLAINREPLFTDTIEAWEVGPAIQSVYKLYRLIDRLPTTQWPANNLDIVYEPNVSEAIEAAWEAAFRLTSDQFVKWVTAKGSPWAQAYSPIKWSLNIDNEIIRKYFEEKVLNISE
jgi:uncharacterized phage-associated protein